MRRKVFVTTGVLVLALWAPVSARGQGIVNGDFEAGSFGFTSDATFVPTGVLGFGQYSVRSTVVQANGVWCGADHTTGTGLFLMCDGFSGSPTVAWRQVVTTAPGQEYTFSAWVMNLACTQALPDPIMVLRVGGSNVAGPLTLPESPANWIPMSGSFVATTTSTTLEIASLSTQGNGNDFAIDDIQLTCVTASDSEPPVLTGMPADIQAGTDPGQCDAVVSWTPPGASDSCSGVMLSGSHAPGDTFPLGTTRVTYTATDGVGNSTDASFTVTVNDSEPPALTGMPANIQVGTDPGQCDAAVSWTAPGATDNCPGAVLSGSHAPGDTFPLGTTRVTYTATDGVGNSTDASFTVTVNDSEPPALALPADLTVAHEYGSCGAVVTWDPDLAADNCPGVAIMTRPVSGEFFAVGSTVVMVLATDAAGNSAGGSFLVTVMPPPAPVELHAADAADGDGLGAAVSLSGEWAFAGAPHDGDQGSDSGSVSIFRRSGDTWLEEQKLLAAVGSAGDRFGCALAATGDTVVIGANQDSDVAVGAGAAYAFVHDGTSWTQLQKLLPGSTLPGQAFGSAVSVNGEVLAVGAPLGAGAAGTVTVLRRSGMLWWEEQILVPDDGVADDRFGGAVSVSGDVIAVGASRQGAGTTEVGAVYVYRHDGTSWLQEQKLLASDAAALDRLGSSVAASGGVIAAGAPGRDDLGLDSGAVYAYRHDGTSWLQEQKLLAVGGAAGDALGAALATEGNVLLAGSAQDSFLGLDAGSALVFHFDGSTWAEDRWLLASDGGAGDLFGAAVALHGSLGLIGAPGAGSATAGAGSSYVLSLDQPCARSYVRGDCNADGTINIADPILLLGYLFPSASPVLLVCEDACDANDDELLNIADPIAVLHSLFGSPTVPLPPPVSCGVDPDGLAGALGCDLFLSCMP